jgi:hypothetical protein
LRKYAREQYNPTTTIFATSTLAGTSMVTVSTKDEYVEIFKAFGELQDALDLALKRYAIEQIVTKVDELRQRDALYQAKYGQDYPTFAQRIATDETFVRHVET